MKLYHLLRPGLVTMDILMPEMDGITATEKIMEMDPAAKIIICSAWGNKEMVVRSFSKGAKDFVVKPLHKERVKQAILCTVDF